MNLKFIFLLTIEFSFYRLKLLINFSIKKQEVYMREFKIEKEIHQFKVAASNSTCDCGAGDGSTGYHSPMAKRISRFVKKTYQKNVTQEKQRTAA